MSLGLTLWTDLQHSRVPVLQLPPVTVLAGSALAMARAERANIRANIICWSDVGGVCLVDDND